MVQRRGVTGRKARSKLSKNKRKKGKISFTSYFQTFKEGDKVCLVVEPAVQKGRYPLRFHGKVGTIAGQRGRAYHVKIKDISKEKTVIVHPVHLKKA